MHNFDESTEHVAFAVRQQRQDYLAMPPHKRKERLAHVRGLLEAERERGQAQPSWLKRHAREIFGELL